MALDEKWKNHQMPCPEPGCKGSLVLRHNKTFDRYFYGCSKWLSTECTGGIGAHADGRPLGIPADNATKKRRIAAHNEFDRLWKENHMSRTKAYKWLSESMGREMHMGELNAEECDEVIALVHLTYPHVYKKNRKKNDSRSQQEKE